MGKFDPTDTFHLEFDTLSMPGAIVVTEVTIKRRIVFDRKAVFRLDLNRHPLFRHLVSYIDNNRPAVKGK